MSEPLTPDFSRYEWRSLESATLHDAVVTVRWPDGTELACYSLWLAENTDGFGLEPRTREALLDPGDLPAPDDLVEACVGADGALDLCWSGGRATRAHPGWLHHVATGHHRPDAYLPPVRPWTAATFSEPPSFDGSIVLDDLGELTAFLEAMVGFGLARLRNAPATESFLAEFGRRIGPLRGSNFGDVFTVRAETDPDSTAYTGLNLGQHTDLPTRETPPGFQFLHCIANSVEGGWSRMTDGIAVVDELRTEYPDDYDALTTLEWTWVNRSTDADHRWTGPVIEPLGRDGQLTLRAFYPVRGFPAMPPADVPRAYAALRRFSAVAHDPRFQIRSPFVPGDLVGFDNRRVLHGRDAFAEGAGGERHLQGCYIDRDDVLSRLRVINKTGQLL